MNLPHLLILFRNHNNYNTNYSILNKRLHIDYFKISIDTTSHNIFILFNMILYLNIAY